MHRRTHVRNCLPEKAQHYKACTILAIQAGDYRTKTSEFMIP